MSVNETESERGALDSSPIASGSAYIALCATRNTEAHLRWLGAQMGFLLNLPAFAALFLKIITPPPSNEFVLLSLGALFVAGANVFLFFIIRRDGKYLELWNDAIEELEQINSIEGGIQAFSSQEYRQLRNSRGRLQRMLGSAIFVIATLWAGFAIAGAYIALTEGGVW